MKHEPHDPDNRRDDEPTARDEDVAGLSDGDEADVAAPAEIGEEYPDPDLQNRLWLRAIVPLLRLRSREADPSGRVQFASDLMYIAACERAARILGSDLPSCS